MRARITKPIYQLLIPMMAVLFSACGNIPSKVITAELLNMGSPDFRVVVAPAAGGAELTTINFPDTNVNGSTNTALIPVPLAIALGNVGFRDGSITAIVFSDADYSLNAASTCAVGSSLSKGAVGSDGTFCNMVIDFSPTKIGAIPATMTITYEGGSTSDTFSTEAFNLTGNGTGLPLLANVKLWLDASDSTTFFQSSDCSTTPAVSDNDIIACWKDKSGNNTHSIQTVLANRPILKTSILNNQSIVRFDGSDDFMQMASLTYKTIFVVGKHASASFPEYSGILGADPDFNVALPNNGYLVNAVGGSTLFANGTSSFASSYKNGNSIAFAGGHDFGAINSFWLGSFELSASVTTPGQLGGMDRNASGLRYWNGDFAEIVVYDTVLTAGERQQVESYLNSKYNIYP